MSLALANQYAKALLEVVSKASSSVKPEDVPALLASFHEVVESSQDLRTALLSPALAHTTKEKIIGRLAEPLGLAREVVRFLGVVARKRRLQLLPEMRSSFQSLLDEREGITRASVAAPAELSTDQRVRLEQTLARISGKAVRCDYQVDPSLLGGVSVKIGSKVYDGSILGRMEELRRRLSI